MWHYNEQVIQKPRHITIDDVQYPPAIFSKWSEVELNNIGIYSMAEIKPVNDDSLKKHGAYVDDFKSHTRTYPVVDKSEDAIANAKLNTDIKDYNNALQAVSDTDKSMARVAEDVLQLLVLNNVILLTDLPLSAQEVIVDRQEKRRLIPKVDPRPKDTV